MGDAINQSETLEEAIDLYAKIKRDMLIEDIVERASIALRTAIVHGVQWLRSHVDIGRWITPVRRQCGRPCVKSFRV